MTLEGLRLPAALAARFSDPRVLGEGAFGRVLRVKDRDRDQLVAVKLLLPIGDARLRDEAHQRFAREAALMAKVQHPNVLGLLEYGDAEGQPYLICQYVDGPSLDRFLEEHGPRLAPALALRLFEELLEGLAAAHQLGVLHRDLKPANVLLTREGVPVLADFGLGRSPGDQTLTATGVTMGSPAYMCPQQMRGLAPSPSWDVYAAGAMLVEMLTGTLPHLGPTLPDTLHRRLHPQPLALRAGGVEVSMAVEDLLDRVLAADEARRPQDGTALLAALRVAAHDDLDRTRELGEQELARVKRYAAVWRRSDLLPLEPVAPRGRPPRGAGAAPPRRPGVTWVPVVAAVLLGASLLPGVLQRRRGATGPVDRGEDAPAQGASLMGRAAAVRARLGDDPDLRAALGIPGDLDPEEALATWRRGRRRWRRMARELGLASLARELAGMPTPPAAALSDLAWVGLAERLLASSVRDRQPGPLYPEGETPDLAAALARVATVQSLVSLSGTGGEDWRATRDADRAALRADGSRWVTVRGMEDSFRHHPEGAAPNPKLRQANFPGAPFVDPTRTLPTFLVDRFYAQRALALAAPTELEGALEDTPGPLVLATCVQNWDPTAHLLLELFGGGVTLTVLISRPATDREPSEGFRDGVLVTVDPGRLPPPPRRFRLTARALQPLGRAQLAIELGEVHQRLDAGGAASAQPSSTR